MGLKPYNEQEFNKLCAEFLGWIIKEKDPFHCPDSCRNYNWWFDTSQEYPDDQWKGPTEWLKFNSDWNWIMEVVEKIEKTSGVSIVGGPVKKPTCVIHLSNLHAKSGQGQSKKEAVVQAIWEFLNLYNEQES